MERSGNYRLAPTTQGQNRRRLTRSSDKGVSLFDGSTWQIMTAADGLPEGKVRLVISDDKGNLRFGTEGGVSYYSR
jgi:ligand-binding sensor domain-containing protein